VSLCLLAGGKLTTFALTAFTLAWTHTVERTAWEEDWRITPRGLVLVEARIKGSGAGMEPPADASFDGTWWRYSPDLPPQQRLLLAHSAASHSRWSICWEGRCREVPAREVGTEPLVLSACPRQG
jgi:hypothetical protein